jgi:DNA primase catalytic subunit
MRLPNDPNKFSSRFRYVEVAKYVPSLKSVIREKRDGKALLIDMDEVPGFSKKHDETGIYTSIFQYESTDIDTAASLGSLCFDFDSPDLEIAYSETSRLVDYLLTYIPESGIRTYFSGGKGFHVECEAIALNISSSDDIAGVSRYIAGDLVEELSLTTADLVIYDQRRMWRLPNSRHQSTGLFKVECMRLLREGAGLDDIVKHAMTPHPIDVPEQTFSFEANQWYREYVYKFERGKQEKANPADLLARFLEQGTGQIRFFSDEDKVFDKFKLFKNCPAVMDLAAKAERNHHLDHYERLFLLSLLTYTSDGIDFLNEILMYCSDYNPEISSAHINDWIKRREYDIGGRPFTCDKAKQVGIMCSGCDGMEARPKIAMLSDGKYIETGELSSPSPVRWAYTIPKGNRNA